MIRRKLMKSCRRSKYRMTVDGILDLCSDCIKMIISRWYNTSGSRHLPPALGILIYKVMNSEMGKHEYIFLCQNHKFVE